MGSIASLSSPYYHNISSVPPPLSLSLVVHTQVNQVLDISFKTFIRMVACFPEKVSSVSFQSSMAGLEPSEKVCVECMSTRDHYTIGKCTQVVGFLLELYLYLEPPSLFNPLLTTLSGPREHHSSGCQDAG